MLHRSTSAKPISFEPGNGENPLTKWFWPMGAATGGGQVKMFWAEMSRTPTSLALATAWAGTRLASGCSTYLFGNTFEQNLVR